MSVRSYVNNTLAAKLRLAEAKRQLEESKAGREGQTLNAGLNVANVLAQQIPAAYKYSNDAALEEAMYNAQAVNLNPRDENGNPIDPVLNATKQVTPGMSALDNKQAAMDKDAEGKLKVLDETFPAPPAPAADTPAQVRGRNTETYQAPPTPPADVVLSRFNDDGTLKPEVVVAPPPKPAKDETAPKKKYANDFDELYESLNGKKPADPAKLAKVLVNQVQQNNVPKDPIGKFVFEFFKIGGMDARTQRIAELQATKLIADRQATERSKYLDELVLRVKLSELKGAAGKEANAVSNEVAKRKMEGEKIVNSARSKLGDIWVNAKKLADPVARRDYVNKNLKEGDFPEGGYGYHSADDAKGLVFNELDKEADEYAKNNKPEKVKGPEKAAKVPGGPIERLGLQASMIKQIEQAGPIANESSYKTLQNLSRAVGSINADAGKSVGQLLKYAAENSAKVAGIMGMSEQQLLDAISQQTANAANVSAYAKSISGTAVSDSERAGIESMFPNANDSAEVYAAKQRGLLSNLKTQFNTSLQVWTAAGYDTSGLNGIFSAGNSAAPASSGSPAVAPKPKLSPDTAKKLDNLMGG